LHTVEALGGSLTPSTRAAARPCGQAKFQRRTETSRRGGSRSRRVVGEGDGHPGNSLVPVGVSDWVGAAAVVEAEGSNHDQVGVVSDRDEVRPAMRAEAPAKRGPGGVPRRLAAGAGPRQPRLVEADPQDCGGARDARLMWAGAEVRVDRLAEDLVGDVAALAVPGPSALGSGRLRGSPGLRLGGGLVGREYGVHRLLDSSEVG